MKHQKIECADAIVFDEDTDTSPLFGREEKTGNAKVLIGDDAKYVKESVNRFYPFRWTDENHLFQCNTITINGTLYKPGKNTLLHFDNTDDGLPEFGRLVKIWQILGMGTFFALQPMDTLTFDVDMNAAVIEESPMPQGYQICRSDDIPSYQVFHAYSPSGKLYIPFKQYVSHCK